MVHIVKLFPIKNGVYILVEVSIWISSNQFIKWFYEKGRSIDNIHAIKTKQSLFWYNDSTRCLFNEKEPSWPGGFGFFFFKKRKFEVDFFLRVYILRPSLKFNVIIVINNNSMQNEKVDY